MIKSFLISVFILLCTVILESSILSNISFFYVVPDLALICLLYFSLLNGKSFGETTGFFSGLFLDFITGIPLGFNCLLRTIIGYITGLFSELVIVSGFVIPILTVGIGTIAKEILTFIISLIFPNINIYIPGIISHQFLYEFLINIILSPFVFKFLDFFKNKLSIKDVKDLVDNV